ncbi:hypothetical protein [Aurantimonas sp. 22II-16-19i]|uniref:hypothetical protein n=1 Tax=Aurantimonas sp. 22II-16-19i TaxID=1317114 RepID=UPI0009F7EA03|nr:hypothetical protein [Aurantimonas sp. 22II-16-19i]ORE90484.1 hypothetical protein ATO4_21420 [Aurantimonas sp. 22II-16-19i]
MTAPRILHPLAGVIAILTIAIFWTATVLSELSGSRELIVSVKTAIPWGFLLLVPALMIAGGSGFTLARGRRGGAIGAKIKRMPIIAANGMVVLIPAALFLAAKAEAAEFDPSFYVVQAVELAAGLVNVALLGLNIRDGFRMTGRVRKMRLNG